MIFVKGILAGAAVAASIALLSGCAPETEPEADETELTGSGHHHVPDAEFQDPGEYPTWGTGDRSDAIQQAESAVTAFVSDKDDEDTWWDGLRGHLSAQAQLEIQGTDPANIAADEVTGDGELTDDSSAYLAWVEVPTDAGTYQVLLSRTAQDAPWLVERLTPPEDEPGED
ncbi:hypothetical protein [Marinactinospora rubrisoli]|uniref:Lipoprotein n=1 Tax=Marinactinospora rubrisoli TaxID=2715399 RepID=A0ABW2KIH2_9ACTN